MSETRKTDLGNVTPEQWKKMGIIREQLEDSFAKMKEREKHAILGEVQGRGEGV